MEEGVKNGDVQSRVDNFRIQAYMPAKALQNPNTSDSGPLSATSRVAAAITNTLPSTGDVFATNSNRRSLDVVLEQARASASVRLVYIF